MKQGRYTFIIFSIISIVFTITFQPSQLASFAKKERFLIKIKGENVAEQRIPQDIHVVHYKK